MQSMLTFKGENKSLRNVYVLCYLVDPRRIMLARMDVL